MKRLHPLHALIVCAIAVISVMPVSAQVWQPQPLGQWINGSVGIGTNNPQDALHIRRLSTDWPSAAVFIESSLPPGFVPDHTDTTSRCSAAGELAVAYADGRFSAVSHAGDVVLRSLLTSVSPCSHDLILSAQSDLGRIRFTTQDEGEGFDRERMSINDWASNTVVDLKAVWKQPVPNPSAALRFFKSDPWSGHPKNFNVRTWMVGMDAVESLLSNFAPDETAFKIGRAAYPQSSFPPATDSVNSFLTILPDGRTIIGAPILSSSPLFNTFKLSVNGQIVAKDVWVTAIDSSGNSVWPDYVFADGYKLAALSDVEKQIKENKHLPNIPSAGEVAKNGVSVNEMQTKLLQKVEELTLYVIEQQKQIKELQVQLQATK